MLGMIPEKQAGSWAQQKQHAAEEVLALFTIVLSHIEACSGHCSLI